MRAGRLGESEGALAGFSGWEVERDDGWWVVGFGGRLLLSSWFGSVELMFAERLVLN